ncbi:hypothetical protein AUJ65_02420 [Candidatus Micrarchaeota archaeon CG1_02_51_15]|nr:MAG: hypothetical protein AUJ65_02420 [Candidatus Micrarchaeota archaeon CG1_02_51_15]
MLSQALKERIICEHREVPCSALEMEQRLLARKIRVSHNKIRAVLKEAGLAKREPKKSKRRKWVRYERTKTNSLWHVDWKLLSNGKWLILFEDDATRLIVGHGLFDSPTAEAALQVFAVATAKHGVPRQLLTDNGTQFCNTQNRTDPAHAFHGAVKRAGVDHVFTRSSHPQCNGKLEKLNHTITRLYDYYDDDLEKAVKAYNEKKLHSSLEWQTPLAVWNKKTAKGLKYKNTTKS